MLEDRIWPEEPKEEDKIVVNTEEDIPYAEKCPYHIYDVYKDAFVIDGNARCIMPITKTAILSLI